MASKAIKKALISVSDKTGLIPFAKFLHQKKVSILSTGGTLKALVEAGIPAVAVDEYTGFPEMMDGRVKTLHPKIHGGLLYRRDQKSHVEQAKKHGIEAIDLVVVNLYPFEKVTSNPDVELETAIENIDIGGPSMLRSAAKNHDSVAVVTEPADYARVQAEMEAHKGAVTQELRRELALKVFQRTAAYDAAISGFLGNKLKSESAPAAAASEETLPAELKYAYVKNMDLRYGENPHQKAAFYIPASRASRGPAFKQLHGKELSFNNLLDIEATLEVMKEFEEPAACVIKHNNPCGIAENKNAAIALEKAVECDSMSAFGGIVGLNRVCDMAAAEMAFDKLKFFEVLCAPSFDPKALAFLQKRQNLRLIQFDPKTLPDQPYDCKRLSNGMLVQERNLPLPARKAMLKKNVRFVTQVRLSDTELEDLIFAFKCVKVVKSNAIVITQGRQTVGIGAGQMSRVDSVEIACSKAGYRTEGGLLASDAFFPMPDSIEVAAQHKIKGIIQPGGSLKDPDVIATCDRFKIAMALTSERHFKH